MCAHTVLMLNSRPASGLAPGQEPQTERCRTLSRPDIVSGCHWPKQSSWETWQLGGGGRGEGGMRGGEKGGDVARGRGGGAEGKACRRVEGRKT